MSHGTKFWWGKHLTIWNLYVGAIQFQFSLTSNFPLLKLLWYAINCMVVILYLYSLLEIELLLMMLTCIVQFEYPLCILEINQPSAKIQNVIYYTIAKHTAGNRCVQQLTTNSISFMQASVHSAYMLLWHTSFYANLLRSLWNTNVVHINTCW